MTDKGKYDILSRLWRIFENFKDLTITTLGWTITLHIQFIIVITTRGNVMTLALLSDTFPKIIKIQVSCFYFKTRHYFESSQGHLIYSFKLCLRIKINARMNRELKGKFTPAKRKSEKFKTNNRILCRI